MVDVPALTVITRFLLFDVLGGFPKTNHTVSTESGRLRRVSGSDVPCGDEIADRDLRIADCRLHWFATARRSGEGENRGE